MQISQKNNAILVAIFIVIILLPLIHLKDHYFGMSVPRNLAFRFTVSLLGLFCLFAFKKILISKLTILYLFYLLVEIASSIFGYSMRESWSAGFERMYGLFDDILLLIVIIAIPSYAKPYIEKKLLLLKIFSIVSLIVAIYAIFQHYNNPEIRAESTLSNPLYLSLYLQFSICVHIYLLDSNTFLLQNKTVNYVYIGIHIAILLGAGLSTWSRSFVFSGIAGMLFFFLMKFIDSKKKIIILATTMMLILTSVIFFYLNNNETIGFRNLNPFANDNSTSVRFELLKMFSNNFAEIPFLGYGKNNVRIFATSYFPPELFMKGFWYDKLHNNFLDKFVEGGILLFLSYIALWIIAFHQIWRKENSLKQPERIFITTFFIMYTFFLLSTFEFLYSQIIWAFLVALISYHSNQKTLTIKPIVKYSGAIIILATLWINKQSASSYFEWNKSLKSNELTSFIKHYETSFQNSIFEKKDIALEFALNRNRVAGAEPAVSSIYMNKSIELLNQTLLIYPNEPVTLSQLGFIYNEAGNKTKAINTYEQLRKVAPTRITNLIDLSIFKIYNGDFKSADSIISYSSKLLPSDKTSEYYRALNFSMQKQNDSVYAVLKSIPPDFLMANINLLEEIFIRMEEESKYPHFIIDIGYHYFKPKNYQSMLKFAIFLQDEELIRLSILAFANHFLPEQSRYVMAKDFNNLVLSKQADHTHLPIIFKEYWYE